MLVVLIVILYFKAARWKKDKYLSSIRIVPILIIVVQARLGIVTFLNVLGTHFKIYALLHQFVGLVLLIVLLHFYFMCSKKYGRITFI